jgi:hypothetical protein
MEACPQDIVIRLVGQVSTHHRIRDDAVELGPPTRVVVTVQSTLYKRRPIVSAGSANIPRTHTYIFESAYWAGIQSVAFDHVPV